MTLDSTQPLTEINTRNISWGKDDRCIGLTNLSSSCADYLEMGEPYSPGNSVPVQACNGIALHLHLQRTIKIDLILNLYGSPCVRTQAALLQYLSLNMSKERRCSGIWRMILKLIYENHGVCIESNWLRRK